MSQGREHYLGTAAATRAPQAAGRVHPGPLDYAEGPKIFFWLFLGYVLFFYLQGGYRLEVLGRIRFELILGSVLIAASFMSRGNVRGARAAPASGVTGWITALFVVAALMTAISRAPAVSWPLLIDRIIKFAMMTLFISSLVTTPQRLRWFLGAYLLAFLKMVQEGVLGYLTGSLVWENQGTPRLHGPTPNYAHPNSFSGTQLGTLPFLHAVLGLVPRWLKPVVIAQALGAIVIVVTTGSRTGYVALLLWVGFLLMRSRSKVKAILIAAVAVLAILPFLPAEYIQRFETIFTQKDEEGASIDTRKEILGDAWQIFTSYPLGVGVGAFTLVRQQMFGRYQATHNLYLEVATDMGVQGLIVFLGLVFAMLRAAHRVAKNANKLLAQLPAPPALAPAAGTAAAALEAHRADLHLIRVTADAVLAFLIIRLGLGMFGHDFYEIYWWFAAGLIMALHRMLPTATERTRHFAQLGSTAREPAAAGAAAARPPGLALTMNLPRPRHRR